MLVKTIKTENKVDRLKKLDTRSPVISTKVYSRVKSEIYNQLLELKAHLLKYIESNRFEEKLSFGYFLNEYIRHQKKTDAQFAIEIGVADAAISQYINNRRKPTQKFMIRLELHSNSIFRAIDWFKLLQKEKEWEIITDQNLRIQESNYVRKRLKF
jgi:plasmid maintenance system antidote protein VapI